MHNPSLWCHNLGLWCIIWDYGIIVQTAFHSRHLRTFSSISRQNDTLGSEENLLAILVHVCYILKHLEDRKAVSVNIYWVAVRRTYVFTSQEVEKICRTLQSHVMLVSLLEVLMKHNRFLL